jgi:hypothetical protein
MNFSDVLDAVVQQTCRPERLVVVMATIGESSAWSALAPPTNRLADACCTGLEMISRAQQASSHRQTLVG